VGGALRELLGCAVSGGARGSSIIIVMVEHTLGKRPVQPWPFCSGLPPSGLGGGSELPLGGAKTELKMLDDSLLCLESGAGDKNRSKRRQLAVIRVPLYALGQRLCKRFDVRGDMCMESCAGQAPLRRLLRFHLLSMQRMRCVTLCAEGLVAWG
jgi:hypothetical protein